VAVLGRRVLRLRGKFAAMTFAPVRLAVLAVVTSSCGGPGAVPAAAPEAPVPDLIATRWVPDKPTYVFGSRSLEVAQGSLRDAVELVGSLAGFDLADAVRSASATLAVDPLHPDPVAAIGIDTHASWAVFSDDLTPTLVVRLAAPELMTAFLDRQRERGMVTRSVVVDATGPGSARTEVVSADLSGGHTLSWAIEGDWMWLHLAPRDAPGDPRWFTASHAAHTAPWLDSWTWAQRAAQGASRIVGYFDLRGAVAGAIARAPEAVACTRLVAQAGRIAVALDASGPQITARVAVDVGSTDAIRALILPPPSGWDAAAAGAPIAAQWNLEIPALRSWLAPCLAVLGENVDSLGATGARAARALVLTLDPDDRTGTGALAFDVSNPAFFAHQLDRIPLRSTLERSRTYGRHKGFSIAIPFAVTFEYVLEDKLALVAIGDGVLARLVAPAATTRPPPIFALDLTPSALPVRTWAIAIYALFAHELSASPPAATLRVAERLQRWRDVHIAVTAEPTAVVLTMSGHRR
jgi:hypothetical protein